MVASVVLIPTSSSVAAAPLPIDPAVIGTTSATAAGSCWEIKQSRPAAANGTYWLLTPKMAAPEQFYCDMTTDGGGWVLVGKGRNGWSDDYLGQTPEVLMGASASPDTVPMSAATAQLGGPTIDALLNGAPVSSLNEGIRLRRATNAAGTSWQEARFKMTKRDRWVWTFGAQHPVGSWSFDNTTGSGGTTASFGSNNNNNRVITTPQADQKYAKAFYFGSGVSGTSTTTSFLFGQSGKRGYAQPYTQVYLRPRVLSSDPGFTRIPDGGLPAYSQRPIADSKASASLGGVTGIASKVTREGEVEVQAFTESNGKMYVGGNFKQVQIINKSTNTVTQLIDQPYLAAFDIETGEFDPNFRPKLNQQVKALATLPDGSIIAGGSFTQVTDKNGVRQDRTIVALKADGSFDPTFNLDSVNGTSRANNRIEVIKVHGDWVYVGGQRTNLSGGPNNTTTSGRMLGRASATDGKPDAWNPDINGTVMDIAFDDAGNRVFAGGFFNQVQGVKQESATAVSMTASPSNIATLASAGKNWTPEWSNSRATYQQAVEVGGGKVWYGGAEHSLFQYRLTDLVRTMGDIFLSGGDLQDISPSTDGEVMYAGCHCNNYAYHNAYTWSNVGSNWTQADSVNWIGAWDTATGDRRPEFTPSFGSRLGSGTWAIDSASDGALWVGGDFTSVSTAARPNYKQAGFARFPLVSTNVPNQPTAVALGNDTGKTVDLTWKLNGAPAGSTRYQILRDNRAIATTAAGATSITVPKGGGEERFFIRAVNAAGNYSATVGPLQADPARFGPSADFSASVRNANVSFDASSSRSDADRPISSYAWNFGDGTTGSGKTVEHTYATAGAKTVTLTVTDSFGDISTKSLSITAAAPWPAPADLYGKTMYNQDPYLYYRFNETSGDMVDTGQNRNNGTVGGSNLTRGAAGVSLPGESNGKSIQMKAPGFLQSTTGYVASKTAMAAPNTFSLDVWFKTSTTKGGRLIGFGDKNNGDSGSYDRLLQLLNTGQVMFGAYPGTEVRVVSPSTYNNNAWHHAVATMGADGMKLYVDGTLVGSNPNTTGESTTGYWKIGTDKVWSGTTNKYFDGVIDEAAVFHRALSAAEVKLQHDIATGAVTSIANQAPTASFEAIATGNKKATFDASGSSDPDGSIVSYAWNFGDGTPNGTGQVVPHTYAEAGTKTITLTVTDNNGATATATRTLMVKAETGPNRAPKAVIAAPTQTGMALSFDGTGSYDDDEGDSIASYAWDFGDSQTGSGATVNHTYAAVGDYTVKLTVTDSQGETGQTTRVVTVADPNAAVTTQVVEKNASWKWRYETAAPPADWNARGFNDASWQSGQGVLGWPANAVQTRIDGAFAAADRPLTAYFRRSVDITDASKVTKLVLNTVGDDGVIVYVNGVEVGRQNMTKDGVDRNGHTSYAVSAISTANAENAPLVIEVPTGLLVNGANTIAAETHLNYKSTPNVTFHLEALLTVDPSANNVNQAPVAAFSSTQDGLAASFDASDSADPDGAVATYAWTFGDGGTGSGVTANHTYAAGGTYPVTLTVTDNKGATGTKTASVTVVAGPSTQVVVADNASWRWWYRTDAPDATWNTNGFDASAWNAGTAVLGWGAPGVVTNIDTFANTNDRARTAYFVGTFDVANAGKVTTLDLSTIADDGVIVYVNGVEVGRKNMADRVGHDAFAVSAVATNNAEKDPLLISVPTNLLVNGTNTIAVETHLNYRGTPNLTFHLQATMTTAP